MDDLLEGEEGEEVCLAGLSEGRDGAAGSLAKRLVEGSDRRVGLAGRFVALELRREGKGPRGRGGVAAAASAHPGSHLDFVSEADRGAALDS